MDIELTEEQKEQIQYEVCIQDFIICNYHVLLAMFVEQEYDKFMEFVEEQYEDKEGKDMIMKINIKGEN